MITPAKIINFDKTETNKHKVFDKTEMNNEVLFDKTETNLEQLYQLKQELHGYRHSAESV